MNAIANEARALLRAEFRTMTPAQARKIIVGDPLPDGRITRRETAWRYALENRHDGKHFNGCGMLTEALNNDDVFQACITAGNFEQAKIERARVIEEVTDAIMELAR